MDRLTTGDHTNRRATQVDVVFLGIVIVFFALCFGMVRLFEKI